MENQSDSINELATALVKAQAKIKAAPKDSVNPHFKSKYADLASVWDACREPLTSEGLSVVQMPIGAGSNVGVRTMLLHTSGQWLATEVFATNKQDNAQGTGSCITYLRRYSLAAMVGVVADEDDDANAASKGAPRSEPRTPAPTVTDTVSLPMAQAIFALGKEKLGSKEALEKWLIAYGVKSLTAIKDMTVERAEALNAALKAIGKD